MQPEYTSAHIAKSARSLQGTPVTGRSRPYEQFLQPLMSTNYCSPRYHRQALRQLHKEFTSRAGDNRHETKRKRLVRPFSQGDVGTQFLPDTSQGIAYSLCLPPVSIVNHTAGFTPVQKDGSYEAAAATLHEQISFDKPWYLLDPEVKTGCCVLASTVCTFFQQGLQFCREVSAAFGMFLQSFW